jgi:hypothetical protein
MNLPIEIQHETLNIQAENVADVDDNMFFQLPIILHNVFFVCRDAVSTSTPGVVDSASRLTIH